MADTFEQTLADVRGEFAVLRRHGASVGLDEAAEVLDRLAAAAEPYTRQLAESDAVLFSGRSAEWLRARFPEWARRGLAERRGGVRYYRECCLPHRTDVAAAREAGREAARAAMGAPTAETTRAA